jgi:nicotinamidase-related amidase
MPARNADLHGLAPDTCPVALVLVDVVSDFGFPDGDRLLSQARPAAERIAGLRRRAREAGVPVVFCNDNFGRWQDDFGAVVRRALAPGSPARDLAERLRPGPDDYVVLKPKHSAFFQTPLDTLLAHLGTKTLVLAGFTGDVCLLATALDANMRDFRLVVPADATASMDADDNEAALAYLRRVADAETPDAAEVDFEALARADPDEGPQPDG